jgi:fructose-bisphosphate aldolase class 1
MTANLMFHHVQKTVASLGSGILAIDEEILYQLTTYGKTFFGCSEDQNIMPGIKVDKVCIQ